MSSSIKRVLFIAPTPFFSDRGCHVHIAEQAWALKRKGLDVVIVTYGLGRNLPGLKTVRIFRFPWYKNPSVGPSWHKFYLDIFLFFKSLSVALRFKPDIIHGHLHEGCLIGWAISKIIRSPLVFDCQGSLTGEMIAHKFPLVRYSFAPNLWYFLEKWINKRANIILVQSRNMYKELIASSISSFRIKMACDGVNTSVFVPGKKDTLLMKKFDIPADSVVIVFLGVLTPYQGVDDLLRAFPLIKKAVPNSLLLIMGYPNISKYTQMAQKLNISNSVRFTGRIPYEEAARYLALGDIAVSPKRSQTEANGKIYNYMACGLPTVAFDTIVNREILGELGNYVGATSNPGQLARAVISLLNKKESLNFLADKLRQKAITKYSWDQVADRIINAYNAAITPWQIEIFSVSIRKKTKWRWIKKRLKPLIVPRTKCLDVGSGVGTLSLLMERLGGNWEFLENDEPSAREVGKIVSGPVHTTDIFDKEYLPSSYDVITAFDLIEHTRDPGLFLKRFHALLKPGGYLLLTTPASQEKTYLWRVIGKKLFNIDEAAHGHIHTGFSRQQLTDLFLDAGYNITHIQLYSFFFTEMIELVYNGAYLMKNKHRQTTSGYNLSLSPSTMSDLSRHRKELALLKIIHPFLLSLSRLDNILPIGPGYEWGIVVQKKNDQ